MSGLEVAAAVASAAISAGSLTNDVAQASINAGQRSVSIHLNNGCKSNILINPQVYTYSGYCYDPPQPTVVKGVTEECSFGSIKGAACGAVGVLTYDITVDRWKMEAVKRLAIMFSVPFDYIQSENQFALGLFATDQLCDKSLYQLMYYENDGKFTRAVASGSEIRFLGSQFSLIGTMSPAAKAEIKVELWDIPPDCILHATSTVNWVNVA